MVVKALNATGTKLYYTGFMAQEQVLDSFLLRVVVRDQRQTYTLQNLRTGELIVLTDSHKILDYVSHGSTKHPPWQKPESS